MKNLLKKKHLTLFISFVINIIYSQTSQILMETQLERYGPDLKTNYYNLSIMPTSGNSFGKSYNIKNGQNTLVFYDLVKFDIKNYPLNCTINSYNKVKPTQTGGPECNENVNSKIASPKSFSTGGCHGWTRFMLLDLPINGASGNCEIISIEKQMILLNAGYSWQYRKENDPTWKYFEYNKHYNKNGLSFSPNDVPDLSNYTGNLFIRFVVEYENFQNNKIENYESNISIYDITTCSPFLVTPPIVTDTRCNNEPSGSVTLKFQTELKENQKFLFNLFTFNQNLLDFVFINNVFVNKSEIINNTFTWNDLGEGNYIIKYQAQSTSDNSEDLNSSLVITDEFTVGSPLPLKFEIKKADNPICADNPVEVSIAVTGGTGDYKFYVDGVEKTNPKPVKEADGYYHIRGLIPTAMNSIKVTDQHGCIEKAL